MPTHSNVPTGVSVPTQANRPSWSDVTVRVEFEPAYELAISLFAYVERPVHRALDLGEDWAKRVRQSLPTGLAKRLSAPRFRSLVRALPWVAVVAQCPRERSVAGFVAWMNKMTRGEAYDYLTTCGMIRRRDIQSRIVDGWREIAESLCEWHEQYFQHLPPDILNALAIDTEQKRSLAEQIPVDELVHQTANGLRLEMDPRLRQVVLVPQYHYRPWNVSHWVDGIWYNQYPLERDVDGHDVAWVQLVRMSRALADESRLRILQHLADGPVRFTDVVAASNLTKSTVHHHLVALRAAHLVVVHMDVEQRQITYALNPRLAEDAKSLLEQVLRLGERR